MKIRLLTNLRTDETTTLPVGKVVDLPDAVAQELLDCGAALVEAAPVEAAPAGDPDADALRKPLDEMTKAELIAFGRTVLQVELNPNALQAVLLAKIQELKLTAQEG